MGMYGVLTGVAALLLVIFWNYMQGKRIDELKARLDGMEKK